VLVASAESAIRTGKKMRDNATELRRINIVWRVAMVRSTGRSVENLNSLVALFVFKVPVISRVSQLTFLN
jgi:hypothetical protein